MEKLNPFISSLEWQKLILKFHLHWNSTEKYFYLINKLLESLQTIKMELNAQYKDDFSNFQFLSIEYFNQNQISGIISQKITQGRDRFSDIFPNQSEYSLFAALITLIWK